MKVREKKIRNESQERRNRNDAKRKGIAGKVAHGREEK